MRLGLIGLGRMGGNMAARLRAAGHEVVGYDRDPAISDVAGLAELAAALPAPRVVWVMVPADVTDVPAVVKSWRSGTVVRSWLLDLLDRALDEDPELAGLRGYAEDTGEGRWTVDEAVRLAVPLHVISAALFARFASRQDDSPAMKAVAALRNQFGGHAVRRD